jgi:hypothetical protein
VTKIKKLMKENKNLNKWRDNQCTWIGTNIIKVSVFLNSIHKCDKMSIKTPECYFVDVIKFILRFILKDNSLGQLKGKRGTKYKYWHLRLTIKLQEWALCGTGETTDKYISTAEPKLRNELIQSHLTFDKEAKPIQ